MIGEKIDQLKQELPQGVNLVAVSKYHPIEAILEAYRAGHRIFGESRVQELLPKRESLPKDIEWHFIGHLQRNKVKYIVPFVSLIHSIDNESLLVEVEKQAAAKAEQKVACLIQIHIATEETKYGFSEDECIPLFEKIAEGLFPHVEVRGLMGMATFTDNKSRVEAEFARLHRLFMLIKERYKTLLPKFDTLSMGMSDDYPIALNHGSTLVRVGGKIFGDRIY